MNPQMQNYRQYAAQAQGRSPATRRPGECDSSTSDPPVKTEPWIPHIKEEPASPALKSEPLSPIVKEEDQESTSIPRIPDPPGFTSYANRRTNLNPYNPRYSSWCGSDSDYEDYDDYSIRRQHRLETMSSRNSIPGQANPAQHAAQQAQAQMMQQQAQQRNAAIEHQLAQRRARKPTDRNLPDGLEDIVIGDGVEQYKKLRDAEKRLDHMMARKRLEIQDSFSKNVKRQKTLRVWISNTASGQPWQTDADEEGFTFESGTDPTYKVKITGRLLEYDDDDILQSDSEEEDEQEKEADKDGDEEMTEGPPAKKPRMMKKERTLKKPSKSFTHFFKAMDVEFDNANNPNNVPGDPNQTVTWKKGANAASSGDFDTLNFERKADENVNITICLTRDEQPERFRLSKALADLLDMEEADRAEVVMGIWDYVRAMGLQEDEERRSIQCDDALKRIFNTETFFFPHAAERIIPHLHPLPPIRLPYTIRVDQAFQTKSETPEATVYDVRVYTEDPLRPLLFKMTQNPEHAATLRQISKIDDELAVLMQAITHAKARHTFFSSMAKDPMKFMQKWLSSQKRDLSVIMGEVEKGDVAGMEFAGSEVWMHESVKEAVRYRLARAEAQSQGGR